MWFNEGQTEWWLTFHSGGIGTHINVCDSLEEAESFLEGEIKAGYATKDMCRIIHVSKVEDGDRRDEIVDP